eukprot:TRINITY_DN54983_c0_g1_i1.p1 TRINITY_DN54983_c0_g1~~TRINITY_DN54983_c0_g1_i1.p1  ORF type:complete len:189 (+),score=25.44 TRINITY_DN54983_c0_g1_i1:38-604(+)
MALNIRGFDAGNGSSDVFVLMMIDADSEDQEHHVWYGPHWWKKFVKKAGNVAFVAENEKRVVVGFIAVERKLEAAYIAWLHVLAQHRRSGVGRSLLVHVVSWLQSFPSPFGKIQVSLHVETTNHAAIALYESVGFVARRESDGEKVVVENYVDTGRDSYFMLKNIDVEAAPASKRLCVRAVSGEHISE